MLIRTRGPGLRLPPVTERLRSAPPSCPSEAEHSGGFNCLRSRVTRMLPRNPLHGDTGVSPAELLVAPMLTAWAGGTQGEAPRTPSAPPSPVSSLGGWASAAPLGSAGRGAELWCWPLSTHLPGLTEWFRAGARLRRWQPGALPARQRGGASVPPSRYTAEKLRCQALCWGLGSRPRVGHGPLSGA